MKRTFTRTIAVMLAVLLICAAMPFTVFAVDTDGTCGDGVYWTYSNGTLAITSNKSGGGTMDNYSATTDPEWVTNGYTDDITKITVKGVKKLGNYAFYGLSNLTEVEFQDGMLENIGTYEFSFCTSLEELTFTENLDGIGQHAFKDSGIKKLTFTRNSLTSAGSGTRQAFRSLSGAEIYVPDGFKLAGEEADPNKYGSAPFYKNYVGFTSGSKASVYWKDDDGSVLEGDAVGAGTTPSYDDEIEEREDGSVFDKWEPEVTQAEAGRIYYYTATYSMPKSTVTWLNWNGAELEVDRDVEYGSTPSYDGITPLKPRDAGIESDQYYAFDGWTKDDPNTTVDLDSEVITENTTYTAHYTVCDNEPIGYVNENGEVQPSITDYTFVLDDAWDPHMPDSTFSESISSWWIVKAVDDDENNFHDDTITINDRIVIDGDVNLLLCDGAALTAPKGITVNSGSSLTVWCQSGGSGALTVNNVDQGYAGIGGTGSVTVNGGNITVNGGANGAGIGGGNSQDGTVTINGGTVTATGGENGAGIGGGNKNKGTVTISGGTVTANGGQYGAGIGSGYHFSGNSGETAVSISGGTVTANGGKYSAGIGHGSGDFNHCAITISGGNVSATADESAAGIGMCNNNSNATGDITLTWTDDSKDTMSVTAGSYVGTVTFGKKFIADDSSRSGYEAGTTLNDNSVIAGITLAPLDATDWEILQYKLEDASLSTITLDRNYQAGSSDKALRVPSGRTVTLDLNGHTIDRNLKRRGDGPYASVFRNYGNLTITDSGNGSGVLRGGNTDNYGGGAVYNEGTLTINGGTFTSNKAYRGGAIANEGTLTINGGTFTGNSAYANPQIGGGAIYNNGTLNLNGGAITDNSSETTNGGGIFTNDNGILHVSGNPVVKDNTAKGENSDIYLKTNQKLNVTAALDLTAEIGIRVANVSAGDPFTEGLSGKGDASGFFSNHAGYRVALNGDNEAYITDGKYNITIDEEIKYGTVTADKEAAYADETVTLTVTPEEGGSVRGVYVNDEEITATNGVYSFTMPADDVTVSAGFSRAPICYVDAYGNAQEPITDYTDVTAETDSMSDGWYVVKGTITNDNRISVSGHVELLLCDNAELNAAKGISVNSGNYLTIWQQENGSGALTASADSDSRNAAIGGDRGKNSGEITINGGVINATGVELSAGIGGGNQHIGTVTINGGNVTAQGGSHAAAIGGGTRGLATVTINGGTVNATGGNLGAGIGSGYNNSYLTYKELNVTVNGGTVTAAGGSNAAAIGCGYHSDYYTCAISINGGTVDASSGGIKSVNDDGTRQGSITLSWTDADNDSITADSYSGDVKLSKSFTDEGNNVYKATDQLEDTSVLAGKTLIPYARLGVHLAGYSVSLDGDIAVNFYMELSDDVINSDHAYMLFAIPNTSTEYQTQTVFLSEAEEKDGYYLFKCRVAAKDMDSEITAQMFDENLTSEIYRYSVRQYADYLIAHQNESEEFSNALPLVEAMITYGENAEYFFNETGDKPEDINIDIPEGYDVSTVHDTLPSDVTFRGASLSLKSQTTLSLYFTSNQNITLSCDDQTVETENAGNDYVIRMRNIAAADLDKSFTVKVNGNDAVTYSPLTYCYKAQSSENEKLANTVKALYLYWVEADKYFD